MDETCKVVALSDDGDSAEIFSWTGDNTKLKEAICRGSLKNGGRVEDEMRICKEGGKIELGTHVASWYNWVIKGVMVEPVDKEDKAMIDERSKAEYDGPGWDEGCDCGRDDEDFPLLPLKNLKVQVSSIPTSTIDLTHSEQEHERISPVPVTVETGNGNDL